MSKDSAPQIVNGYSIKPAENLTGADLSNADLWMADLSKATLLRANLSGTDLSGTDLEGANLSGANLSGANLSASRLRGTTFWGALLGSSKPEKPVFYLSNWKACLVMNQTVRLALKIPDVPDVKNILEKVKDHLLSPPKNTSDSFSAFILKEFVNDNLDTLRDKYGDDTLLALILIKSCPERETVPDLTDACASRNPQEWQRLWSAACDLEMPEQKPAPLPKAVVISKPYLKPPGFLARIFSRFTRRDLGKRSSEQELLPPGGPAPGT